MMSNEVVLETREIGSDNLVDQLDYALARLALGDPIGALLQKRKGILDGHGNLGAAYFSKKEFDKAITAYNQAVQMDPDIFERTSHTGVTAQMSSPEDRAHYDYVVAKLYAKLGELDRSLQYLRRAMEEGFKNIEDVYKDAEFAQLRKDPRFTQLMALRPPAITD